MAHDMNKLIQEGIELLRRNPGRDFDTSDLIHLLIEEEPEAAIISALQAGYALGYQHGQQDIMTSLEHKKIQ